LIRRVRSVCRNGVYAVTVLLLGAILLVLFRVRVRGRKQHVDPREGYIAVARHRSYWDAPLLAVGLGWWNRIHFIARKGLMKDMLLLRPFLRMFSTMIDRESFSKTDFRNVLQAIREERLVGIFPEGTTRQAVDAKAGAIRFAAMTDKKLLPVNIRVRGPYPPRYPFRFPQITVSIGEPVSVEALERETVADATRSAKTKRMSERLMELVDAA